MASEEQERGKQNEHGLSCTTLFARNLSYTVDSNDLEKVFSDVGPVKRCFVVKDKDNPGNCRGFGYVTFALKEDAVKAKETIKHINGRKVFLTFSNKKPRHRQREQSEANKTDTVDKDDFVTESGTSSFGLQSPEKPSENVEKRRRKAKSERAPANNADGRTIVLSGFLSTVNVKHLKKACKKFGEIEQFIYPVENCENPTAHVVYKSHKMSRTALNGLNGKILKGSVLNVILFTKQNKKASVKSLKKSRLIIRNLPFKCSKEILVNEFGKFGEISEIILPTKTMGKNKKKLGFAFVQYKNVFEAAKALEGMNQKEIKGRPIAVDWTLPKKKYELLKVGENEQQGDCDQLLANGGGDDEVTSNASEELKSNEEDEPGNQQSCSEKSSPEESEVEDSDTDHQKNYEKNDKKRRKLRDARAGKTIFIRNLPFDANEEEISNLFDKFGKIVYCKVVMDDVTEHSRGSAFVKFEQKQSAEDCLRNCGANGDDREGTEMTLRNRPLNITLAVPKGKVPILLEQKDSTKKTPRDKRNLYLAKEGLITPGSQAAVGLKKSDLQKRLKAEAEKKAKLKMPHYIVSKTRLCFRNLPLNVDNKKLSETLGKVCRGKPKKVRKVQIMRSADRLDSSGVGRSKGFGFVEFFTHEDALEVLRATNNNPEVFGPDRRPIVEFAIENSLILKRQEQRKTKNQQKLEEMNKQDNNQEKGKIENRKGRKRKRDAKNNRDHLDNGGSAGSPSKKQKNPKRKQPTNQTVAKFAHVEGNRILEQNPKPNPLSIKSFNTVVSENGNSLSSNTTKAKSFQHKSVPSSRSKHKLKAKETKEEEKFNNIVEIYKSKLFGDNAKQLKASRWFQ